MTFLHSALDGWFTWSNKNCVNPSGVKKAVVSNQMLSKTLHLHHYSMAVHTNEWVKLYGT